MSFRDIRGHSKPIKMLEVTLERERNAPAYLFIGEEGIGKRLVAKTLAKALNCLKSKAFDSCDECISCRKIEDLNHPDVHWIAPERPSDIIKIEQIRQLKNDIYLKPYEAKIKVFIVDGAQHLTPEASNAFLKVLEEPPQDSLLILITSKPRLIFPTLLSRCQKLRFYPLKKSQLRQILLTELKLNVTLSHYLAHFCEGRIGKAMNLKTRDILPEKNRVIDEFTPLLRTATAGHIYENIEFNRARMKEDLNILASWFRDIYFIKVGIPYTELINLDRKDDLLRVMSRYSLLDLDSIINCVSDSLLYLEQNINPKLLLSTLRTRLWRR